MTFNIHCFLQELEPSELQHTQVVLTVHAFESGGVVLILLSVLVESCYLCSFLKHTFAPEVVGGSIVCLLW